MALATFVLASAGAARAQCYTVQTKAFPTDPTFTQLLGINDTGTIVGTHGATVPQGIAITPPSGFITDNVPNATQTTLTGISGNGGGGGTAVGFFVDSVGTTHGFAQSSSGFFAVDVPGTAFNQVLGISNNALAIAGYSSTDPTGLTLQQAYKDMSVGGITNINTLLPTNTNSQATGINDAGTAVGFYLPSSSPGSSVGFIATGNTITQIDPFGSTFTQALGIDNNGEIVGFYTTGNASVVGFVANPRRCRSRAVQHSWHRSLWHWRGWAGA